MTRSQKTEQELRDWIIRQVQRDRTCADFSAEFSILRHQQLTRSDPTWDVQTVRAEHANPLCLGRFQRAVEDAQHRFDLKS